jgi:hypothetical protein
MGYTTAPPGITKLPIEINFTATVFAVIKLAAATIAQAVNHGDLAVIEFSFI